MPASAHPPMIRPAPAGGARGRWTAAGSQARARLPWARLPWARLLCVTSALAALTTACVTTQVNDLQGRDTSRMSLEFVTLPDMRRPEIGPDGEAGAALHVAKPLWLGTRGFLQTGMKLSTLIGVAGTSAMYSAVSIDVGLDVNFGDNFGMRWYLGPYMGTQFLTPGYSTTTGVYYYSGYHFALGRDPRERILIGAVVLLPVSGFGSARSAVSCPDQDFCVGHIGFSVGYEGMFL